MKKTLLFDPYTGKPRHPSDIASDPNGLLIVESLSDPLAPAPKTTAERKRDERGRHRDKGRVPVQVWVRPDYVAELRALEAKLQRRERRKTGPADSLKISGA